jgi:hypothetical protein
VADSWLRCLKFFYDSLLEVNSATHTQPGDLISLLLLLQNKESKLKVHGKCLLQGMRGKVSKIVQDDWLKPQIQLHQQKLLRSDELLASNLKELTCILCT